MPATKSLFRAASSPWWFLVALVSAVGSAGAVELQGYTEPYRTHLVASDETGTIQEVFVREGEEVAAGQPLARLNSEVYEALLAIADQNMRSEGRLDAMRAELNLREQRLGKLETLMVDGHARQEEVDRAVAEVAIGEANVRSAQEDLVSRKLEYERIKTQIARRTVRAPVAGVITKLQKDLGEFVAPNNPDVLTLVQIDTLLANFTLLGPQAEPLRRDQPIKVRFTESGLETQGTIEFVAPVTDAESGTVLVKVRIANLDSRFRSGQRCEIRLDQAAPAAGGPAGKPAPRATRNISLKAGSAGPAAITNDGHNNRGKSGVR